MGGACAGHGAYNGGMKRTFRTYLPVFALLCAPAALAQSTATPPPGDADGIEQRVERITHEDSGSRIDELRVGGQTRSIVVSPKAGLPAYQVQPVDNRGAAPDQPQGTAGRSSWRVLSF